MSMGIVDPELDEFFECYEYQWVIFDKIDREVRMPCAEISASRFINSGFRGICFKTQIRCPMLRPPKHSGTSLMRRRREWVR